MTIKVAPGNGSFSVAVHDTGPGIDPANQEKLFEEFQQADNSITKAKGGTGLGLAIARRIIELHGGRLWVDSSPGNGSIFDARGLGTSAKPSKLQQAFIDEQAAQCGYCINGMIMTSAALLAKNKSPSEDDIRDALADNLCRCGTHKRIVAAVKRAAAA